MIGSVWLGSYVLNGRCSFAVVAWRDWSRGSSNGPRRPVRAFIDRSRAQLLAFVHSSRPGSLPQNMGQSAQTAHPDGLIGRIRPAALPRMRRVVRLSGSSASC
jgi:hypothetical protein